MSSTIGNMIILAREYRMYSQSALADLIRVNQSQLSKIEHGFLTPSPELLSKIATVLDFPPGFFREQVEMGALPYTFYRKRIVVSQQLTKSVQARLNVIRFHIGKLLQAFDMAEPTFKTLRPEIYAGSLDSVAHEVRAILGIPRGPIADLTRAIECSGVIVVPVNFGSELIDGISIAGEELPPMIFMNSEVPGDRWRWTLAHEFGHIILHNNDFLGKDVEAEANAFASALLMPARDIRPNFMERITFKKLASLKLYWKVSIQALIMRAAQLGFLSEYQKGRFFTQINRMGWKKNEPNPIQREEPEIVRELFSYHNREMDYSNQEISRVLSLSETELYKLYPEAVGKPKPQLRLF